MQVLPSAFIGKAMGVAHCKLPVGKKAPEAIVRLHQSAFARHCIDAEDFKKLLVAPVIRDEHLVGEVVARVGCVADTTEGVGKFLYVGFHTGIRRQRSDAAILQIDTLVRQFSSPSCSRKNKTCRLLRIQNSSAAIPASAT